jgi:hypothetical protein
MLDKLTQLDFAPLVADRFRLVESAVILELELLSAETASDRGHQGLSRQPFSLVFRGPHEPLLPQRIYSLRHPSLGALEIFLVPIGPDESGQRYEAVFS